MLAMSIEQKLKLSSLRKWNLNSAETTRNSYKVRNYCTYPVFFTVSDAANFCVGFRDVNHFDCGQSSSVLSAPLVKYFCIPCYDYSKIDLELDLLIFRVVDHASNFLSSVILEV